MLNRIKGAVSADMLVGLSALTVSLVAVIVSLYSASVDREYARASVWPRVQIYRSFSITDNMEFSYGVSNFGTGPALIKYAKVEFDGNPVKTWREMIDQNKIGPSIGSQSHISTTVMPANFSIVPYMTSNKELVEGLLKADDKIAITLCYCSIYEECWITDRSNTPQPIDHCEIDKAEAFLQ